MSYFKAEMHQTYSDPQTLEIDLRGLFLRTGGEGKGKGRIGKRRSKAGKGREGKNLASTGFRLASFLQKT